METEPQEIKKPVFQRALNGAEEVLLEGLEDALQGSDYATFICLFFELTKSLGEGTKCDFVLIKNGGIYDASNIPNAGIYVGKDVVVKYIPEKSIERLIMGFCSSLEECS